MLFHTLDFAIFLPIVFVLYWFVTNRNLQLQNLLMVLASYLFYGWWDYRFLSLLLLSSLVDFCVGIYLAKENRTMNRKMLLWISLIVNLGMLGFFKYYNFFLQNFVEAFSFFGKKIQPSSLNIILPVGISFYSFQTLSYVIDVYRRKLEPTRNFIAFSAFVSFFPQLVAGPIERATSLLPQFYVKRHFDYTQAVYGLRQILWGLFKKMVIADNCAIYANMIFDNSSSYSGLTLVLGSVFFAFQIYCDFSGYSDIALGTARLFGFRLMRNFAYPYFSRDIGEFWRRWHISLSTWFRDYVYIPLGGSQGSAAIKIRNIFIIFLVSGFWHGANWTFIAWGALNALYFLPLMLTNKNRDNIAIAAQGQLLPSSRELAGMIITFSLTLVAWIFFRAENMQHALSYLERMFAGLTDPAAYREAWTYINVNTGFAILLLIAAFIVLEWIGRERQYAIQNFSLGWSRPLRWAFYYSIAVIVFLYAGKEQQFIYFQF